jgi:hypothetical protein
MRRPTFIAPRSVRAKRPCESAGLADCLEAACYLWREGKCSWRPSSERQAEVGGRGNKASNALEGLDKDARTFARGFFRALAGSEEKAAKLGQLLGPGEVGRPSREKTSSALEVSDHNARYFARQYFEAERAEDVRA